MNKEGKVVEFTSKTADSLKGASIPSELGTVTKINIQDSIKPTQIKTLKTKMISVIKKDGTVDKEKTQGISQDQLLPCPTLMDING